MQNDLYLGGTNLILYFNYHHKLFISCTVHNSVEKETEDHMLHIRNLNMSSQPSNGVIAFLPHHRD